MGQTAWLKALWGAEYGETKEVLHSEGEGISSTGPPCPDLTLQRFMFPCLGQSKICDSFFFVSYNCWLC